VRATLLIFVVPVLLGIQLPRISPDLSGHFKGLNGTFVLLNATTGEYIRHNPSRAAQRFAPCSTFKIPHTAILLETGAAPDPTYTLKYDPALKQPVNWARDFDLTGAFKASALWYYQTLARRVGLDVEERLLQQFQYGNHDVSGGLDRPGTPFWVDGSLAISADEQIEFLRKLYGGHLQLSERTTRLTKAIMVAEETPRWRLSAKTGACQPQGHDTSNWYVGYVEKASPLGPSRPTTTSMPSRTCFTPRTRRSRPPACEPAAPVERHSGQASWTTGPRSIARSRCLTGRGLAAPGPPYALARGGPDAPRRSRGARQMARLPVMR
jgi:beta-lactamase class D